MKIKQSKEKCKDNFANYGNVMGNFIQNKRIHHRNKKKFKRENIQSIYDHKEGNFRNCKKHNKSILTRKESITANKDLFSTKCQSKNSLTQHLQENNMLKNELQESNKLMHKHRPKTIYGQYCKTITSKSNTNNGLNSNRLLDYVEAKLEEITGKKNK